MADRLKQFREQLGHNQFGMAEVAGIEQATWSRWEKQTPSQFEALVRLSAHYHVSADYLLGIVDDPEGRRGLSPEVLEVLSVWGSLDSNQRRLVMDTMRMLARVTTPHIIGGEEDNESI